jgi:uncharacterized membrane protein
MKQLVKLLIIGLFISIYSSTATVFANDSLRYAVTGVTTDDYLNVRSKASARSAIVIRIPYDTAGIRRLEGEAVVVGQTWWRIKWQGKQGWVNKRYLKKVVQHTGSSATGEAKPAILHCGGNEPFWGMKITQHALAFSPMSGQKINVPVIFNKTSENNTSIAAIYAKKNGKQVIAMLQKVSACSDGMSDINYPYAIAVIINNKQFYSGCCHVK